MASSRIVSLTPDFSDHPDLTVMFLGMKATSLRGLFTLLTMRARSPISKSIMNRPHGLLYAENTIMFSLWPIHIGMRWYWRDQQCMIDWSQSMPHRGWWQAFSTNTRGTSFWHETYFMRGGMEAMYFNIESPTGLQAFLPMKKLTGTFAQRTVTARTIIGKTPSETS